MSLQFGDIINGLVYVKHPIAPGGYWLNPKTGQVENSVSTRYLQQDAAAVYQPNSKKAKPSKVFLVRYIRPWNYVLGTVDNMNGTTFYIELDYVNFTIRYSLAVCTAENFDKDVGTRIAQERFNRGEVCTIQMKNGKVSSRGVLFDIIHNQDSDFPRQTLVQLSNLGYGYRS